jgi:hypothetical protein
MIARLKLLACFTRRVSLAPPTKMQPRCVHRLHSNPAHATHRDRALVLLASGIVSVAAYNEYSASLRSPPHALECAPSALDPVPVVDQVIQAPFAPPPTASFLKRCRDTTVMVVRCTVVSIILFPASLFFVLNRISNGYLISEQSVARVLTWSLQFLGPAAIKFGQWASSRDDLFPPVITKQLARLQSHNEPHAFEHTLSETNNMLNAFRSLNPGNTAVRFEDIEAVPLGSGSIAQVCQHCQAILD